LPLGPTSSQSQASRQSETTAMLSPGPSGAQRPPASNVIRRLDPEDIKRLIKQGEQFAAAGDLVTARLVFQRAAEAGDATAALAMGASYDPIVLADLGFQGISADVGKARSWYEKAKEFGSLEASRRLELLAHH
jgi:TPR repeat protein